MRVRALAVLLFASACSSTQTVDAGVDAGLAASCDDIFGDRETQVCLRWSCDRRDLSEGTWTGDAGACAAGDLIDGRDNALKLINLYRFIAELPEVQTSPMRDAAAQQCAVMMHAANALDHMPGTTWPCYAAAGAQAAGNSNLSPTPAVEAVDLYMADPGNATTLGHRRWLLAATLGPMGIGGTTRASCHWVTGGTMTASKRFVAWPAPGAVPLAALTTTQVATTGWSVHTFGASDDLAGATVAVLDNGADAPVELVTQLDHDFGSRYAISFKPRGWAAQAGHEYVVNVVAPAIMSNPIVYKVQVVGCP